jgi:hypothetical protein
MRRVVVIALALSLCGCAGLPAATVISLSAVGVSAGALAVTAYHNCRSDGGCKDVPLPK